MFVRYSAAALRTLAHRPSFVLQAYRGATF
jgi:hypothetical protein